MNRHIPVLLLSVCVLSAGEARADALPQKTLDECLQIAVEKHPLLGAADATVRAAAQQVWQAASNYLPQVSANYSANRRNATAAAQTGTNINSPSQTYNFFTTGVSFTQVLFDFGRTLATIRAAQETERSAQADFVTEREVIILGVKQAYYNVLAARRLMLVADDTVRDTKKQMEQAQGRFDVGLAPRFDVTRAEVNVATAELNQVTAQNNLDVARITLRNAMGVTGAVDFEIVDTLDIRPVVLEERQALDTAYADRPELQSFDAQRASQEQQIAALQRNYLPSIGGTGTYYWSGNDYPLGSNWNIGASVTLSVFNGGLTTAQIGQAKAILSNLEFNEESTRQNIALQVRQALYDVKQSNESIRVAEKGLQSARESLTLAEGRYSTGVGNIIELTDAQTSLTSAEASLVQSLANFQISVAALERAIGHSIRPPGES